MRSTVEVYYSYAPSGLPILYDTNGDLAILIRQYWRRKCPLGIVLDRLEEYPTELEAHPLTATETVAEIVAWLRSQKPVTA
jgi:hypothetical protein